MWLAFGIYRHAWSINLRASWRKRRNPPNSITEML